MRTMIKFFKSKFKSEGGYTLVELAIVSLIVGLIVAPASYAYSLYIKNIKIEQTKTAVMQAQTAIGDFKAIYGRYPCPARMDLVQGDPDYGYEYIDGAGNCQSGAGEVISTPSNSTTAPQNIFIGSLPFRQMNLPHELIKDGYGARLTYAVSGLLTDDTTYSNANGGITIIDENGNSSVDPDDSAHFVILSHGHDNDGAISQDGIQIGAACPATLEGENCNFDETFRVSQRRIGFDDRIVYSAIDSIEQWQIADANPQDIHLRRANSIATSITESDSTVGFTSAEILNFASASGNAVLWAEADAANLFYGSVLTQEICDDTGANCFPSEVLAGQITSGEGMDCGAGFLVAVKNGGPVCSNEIFFSCPTGSFINGIDSSGRLVCDVPPPASCASDTRSICGDSRTINPFYDTPSGKWYGYIYAGDYYTIGALSTATLSSATSIADVNTYINSLNSGSRSTHDAGPSSSSAQVRATYKCKDDGTWDNSPARTLERYYTSTNLGSSSFTPLYNTSPYNPAETSGPSYNTGSPMAADSSNTGGTHDCWCREDYKVDTAPCTGPSTGTKFRILKHPCPQTGHQWSTVYNWDSSFCTCTPGTPYTETQSCKSYFGYSGTGITGNVVKHYLATCPGGTLDSVDTSGCQCPAMSPGVQYDTVPCPTGWTNSFTWDGKSFTNKKQVTKRQWVCPQGTPPAPAHSAADAGSWQVVLGPHTQACTCTNTTITYTENCPSHLVGTGKVFKKTWNCATGAYDPPVLVSQDCNSCTWHKGNLSYVGSPGTANKVGTGCSSCTDAGSCHEVVGVNNFKVYNSCYCAP